MSDSSGDRRPVKSRSWKVSQALATWLDSRNCFPNLISEIVLAVGLAGGFTVARRPLNPPLQ